MLLFSSVALFFLKKRLESMATTGLEVFPLCVIPEWLPRLENVTRAPGDVSVGSEMSEISMWGKIALEGPLIIIIVIT